MARAESTSAAQGATAHGPKAPDGLASDGAAAASPSHGVGAFLLKLLQQKLGAAPGQTLSGIRRTRQAAAPDTLPAAGMPVLPAQVYFETLRVEARRPLLVSSSLVGKRTEAEHFMRIAVLLGDDQLGLAFNWLGPTQGGTAAALRAAGIGQFDADTDAARAQRLGSAWLYLAATAHRGHPIHLLEAMAIGLPCVALDSEQHRRVIVNGETGLLCRNLADMLQSIAQLVDSMPLRLQMGQQARQALIKQRGQAMP